jgi:hypothetical protein
MSERPDCLGAKQCAAAHVSSLLAVTFNSTNSGSQPSCWHEDQRLTQSHINDVLIPPFCTSAPCIFGDSFSLIASISGRISDPTARALFRIRPQGRRCLSTRREANIANIIVPTGHSRCKHAASPRCQPRAVNNCSPRRIAHPLCRHAAAQHPHPHSTHITGSQRFLPFFLLEGCPVCVVSPPSRALDRLPRRYTPQTLNVKTPHFRDSASPPKCLAQHSI